MSIPIGTTFGSYYGYDTAVVVPPPQDTSGARSVSPTSGDSTRAQVSLEIDELAGRIGPVVGAYDPEGTDRMIQEF